MNNKKTLEIFLRSLEEYGYPSIWEEATEAINFDRIIVNLGSDSIGRNRLLLIRLIDFPLSAKQKDAEHLIQLFYLFPFCFQEASAAELSRLLIYYNNTFDLPGFGLDELTQQIYFKQNLLKPNGLMSKRTFIAIVGAISMFVETFSDTIEEVAGGKSMKKALMDTIMAFKAA